MSRAVVVFAVLCLLSAAALVTLASGDDVSRPLEEDPAPTSFSYRARGQRAFRELLGQLGYATQASRAHSGRRARDGLLVLAQPDSRELHRLASMIARARVTLVVLPKWKLRDAKDRKHELMDPAEVAPVLEAVDLEGVEIVRQEVPRWGVDALGAVPEPRAPVQLARSRRLNPLLACDQGVLIGRVETRFGDVVLLADPDVVTNHGLARGDNAVLAANLVRLLAGPSGAVVFDETCHGLHRSPGLLASLARPPLAGVVAQALVMAAVLVWAASVGFGRPVPLPGAPKAGKFALIDNVASLQRHVGGSKLCVRRYLAAVEAEVAGRVCDSRLGTEDRGPQLERLSRLRGCRTSPRELEEELVRLESQGERRSSWRLRHLALRIHAWRKEMMDGSREAPRDG